MNSILDSKTESTNSSHGSPSAPKKARLGRGLSSLLGDSSVDEAPIAKPVEAKVAPTGGVLSIEITNVYPNPNQPRKHFEADKIEELAASIRVQGIIQPILVSSREDGSFEIIAGERRWRAAKAAGLSQIPVIIKETEPQHALELAIIENIQRQDLNPVEEARAYSELIKKFGLSQGQVAQKVGKDRATVANLLRILGLHPEILELVATDKISLGHAKVLLSDESKPRQRRLARKVMNEGLSVRALEKMVVKEKKTHAVQTSTNDSKALATASLADELQKLLGTKVEISYANAKGQVAIHFYSDEQLNEIIEKMRKTWQKD